ncbi:MAG: hypothetical protein M1834_009303 [Cirrosporium novae-zelandiae]|nr:MAG: hypothetical protein M1834_009303 [Cirrosporium novae-zelandiae]
MSSTTTATSSNSIIQPFTPSILAKLQPTNYLIGHLSHPTPDGHPRRPNARKPLEFRPSSTHTGSLSHTNGSAVVRIGDTAVVCGVRAETLLAADVPAYKVSHTTTEDVADYDVESQASHKMRELGLLVPNIELATGSSMAHLPGNPPSTLAQSLSQRLLELLYSSNLINFEHLKILYQPSKVNEGEEEMQEDHHEPEPEVKAFWCLYIDILFISLDGNPFDAAWAAVMGALQDTKLPFAWWDIDREIILCDESAEKAKELGKVLTGRPYASTFAVFEKGDLDKNYWVLADPDTFEEALCQETVTVVVDDETIIRLEKSGGANLGIKDLRQLVTIAQTRQKEWSSI